MEFRRSSDYKPVKESAYRKRRSRSGNYKYTQPFLAYDGEGVSDSDGNHRYILLGNSQGDYITGKSISTARALAFLVYSGHAYMDYIGVSFSFTYDVNMILKDVPRDRIDNLQQYGSIWWNNYYIEHLKGKWFFVKDMGNGHKCRIYDAFTYFTCSFVEACKQYLGYNQAIEYITYGKESRSEFKESDMDTFIKPYMTVELELMVQLMEQLREFLNEAGIYPTQWYGPGSVATCLLKTYSVRAALPNAIEYSITEASQYAYYGGRFEQYYCGHYDGKVYAYDIRSAYPYALSRLPNFNKGTWQWLSRNNVSFESISEYSLYHILYLNPDMNPLGIGAVPCRTRLGTIHYSHAVDTWLWGIELKAVMKFSGNDSIEIQESWNFQPSTEEKPFAFISDLYDTRMRWKSEGKQAQLALKLCINSVYGKLAQRKQNDTKNRQGVAPSWHNLQYAGLITATCRAMILNAMADSPDSILGVETDGLYSMKPLDLPISNQLGDWESGEYDGMMYVQSGVYWLKIGERWGKAKTRGMAATSIGIDDAFNALPNLDPLVSKSVMFHGYGKFHNKDSWLKWQQEMKEVKWGGNGKRKHDPNYCPKCQGSGDVLHSLTMRMQGIVGGDSYKHSLPWIDGVLPIQEERDFHDRVDS